MQTVASPPTAPCRTAKSVSPEPGLRRNKPNLTKSTSLREYDVPRACIVGGESVCFVLRDEHEFVIKEETVIGQVYAPDNRHSFRRVIAGRQVGTERAADQ